MTHVVRPYLTTGLCMEMMLVGQGLTDLYNEIEKEYVRYLRGDKTNKFSTKVDNNDHFVDTREVLKAELGFFNYKERVDQVVLGCPTRYYYFQTIYSGPSQAIDS